MNARIIKETRSVLPVLVVTMLVSVAPRLIWERKTAGGAGLAFFTLCCVLMGAASFGNEFQWRTMPLLLAQPVPRRRIWNEKMLVLGCALALGLVFFLVCVPLPEKDSYLFLAVVPFCVLCVAPYMALQIKNTLIAAVCTFALPFGICGSLKLATTIFSRFFPEAGRALDTSIESLPYTYAIAATAVYCGVCYRLGYRTFLRLEAIYAQAKEIALPARMEAALAGPFNRLLPRYRGAWTSLLRKELQIQKAAFVFAFVMCVVSVPLALAWDVDHTDLLAGMAVTPIAVLVFVIPFIAPGGCVSEERSWGVSAWQRALPVSSRKQWAAKMVAVIFTCVLLGVVLPAALWMADGWVFHLPFGPGPMHWDRLFRVAGLNYFLGYLLWLSLGAFASSLCANSAKAVILNLGLMVGGAGLAGGMISWISRILRIGPSPGQTSELDLVLLAIYFAGLIGLTQCLAYHNHRTGEPDTRRVWMQVATVISAIVVGADLGFVLW
jgi:ABC-type transport system involved in multi-copper enzyme maturation permease subunit